MDSGDDVLYSLIRIVDTLAKIQKIYIYMNTEVQDKGK